MSQRRSELNSLMTGLSLVGQMAQFDPSVLDKVSSDKVVDEAWSILGAPTRVIRDDQEVQVLRETRANLAQEERSMALVEQGAKVVESGSKVDLNLAKAQEGKK